jgi:uncharacterized protein (UPF0335 family)
MIKMHFSELRAVGKSNINSLYLETDILGQQIAHISYLHTTTSIKWMDLARNEEIQRSSFLKENEILRQLMLVDRKALMDINGKLREMLPIEDFMAMKTELEITKGIVQSHFRERSDLHDWGEKLEKENKNLVQQVKELADVCRRRSNDLNSVKELVQINKKLILDFKKEFDILCASLKGTVSVTEFLKKSSEAMFWEEECASNRLELYEVNFFMFLLFLPDFFGV